MRLRTALLPLMAAAVVLAACGDGDDTATTSPTTVTTAAPTTSADPGTTTIAPPTTSAPTTAPPLTTPPVDTPEARADLDAARTRWATGGSDDVVLRQVVLCFCPVEATGPFRVDVVDGDIVAVEHAEGLDPIETPVVRTVPELFEEIELALDVDVAGLDVTYDDTTGLPTYVFIDPDAGTADEEFGWDTEWLTDQTPTRELAGEPFDGPQAGPGAELIVVGVTPDDALNVRAGPGVDEPIVATLPADGGAVATGQARLLPASLWFEITTPDGTTGWANRAFLAEPGVVDDLTSRIIEDLGERPEAETLEELAEIVAATRASIEPPSEITVVAGPSEGDLGEITVDVLGLGDDAVLGERLHIFANPPEAGSGWVLRTVEVWTLCGRGVTDDGLCL